MSAQNSDIAGLIEMSHDKGAPTNYIEGCKFISLFPLAEIMINMSWSNCNEPNFSSSWNYLYSANKNRKSFTNQEVNLSDEIQNCSGAEIMQLIGFHAAL